MAGKTVTCSINVSGAEDKYCTTQFHIYYDQRLKIIDKDERELCTKGSAIDNLYKLINQRDFTHDILVNETDDMVKMNSFIYAFDISYCNDNLGPDYFTNSMNDDSGKLMQAYAFTKGIFNGKTRLFEPDSDDVDLCPALEKISSQADGYIAMEGTAPEVIETTTTTTTTPITTTTTSSEATTTTTLPDKYKSTLSYENDEDSPLYYIPEESSGYNIKAEVEVEGPKKLDETDSADSSIINAIRSYLTSSFEKALKAIGDPERLAEKTEQIAEEAVKSFNEISDTGYTATKIEIADISKSDKGDLKYTLGDLNDDGAVDGTDATIVLREFGNILAGKGESFTPEQVAAGDVDRNGVIDGSDATIILKFYGEAGNDIEISYAGMVPWMEKNYWNR